MSGPENRQEWSWQIRINLSEKFAEVAGRDMSDPALAALVAVLNKYDAILKNQYDAFADYCRAAEAAGETDSVNYRWTKDTIEKPGKKEQYATRFTIYADGGKELYGKDVADALEADLQPLKDSGMITLISKIDSNPANNPQAPARFYK